MAIIVGSVSSYRPRFAHMAVIRDEGSCRQRRVGLLERL